MNCGFMDGLVDGQTDGTVVDDWVFGCGRVSKSVKG